MILFSIAWRNIWRNKIRSLLIMLSVAVGLFSGMMALGLYKGMMTGRIKTVIGFETGSLQLHHPSFKNDFEPGLILGEEKKIKAFILDLPDFAATTSRSVAQGMLSTTTGSTGVLIRGIDPDEEYSVSGLNQKVIAGKFLDSGKLNGILIGKKLADRLKLLTGKKLVLTFTDVNADMVSAAFRVAGIYRSENAPMDERIVYVQSADLNALLRIGQSAHEQVIRLKGDEYTENARMILQKAFPDLLVETWRELSPETKLMVEAVDVYSYIIIVIILIALAFGIINTMLMAVLERIREIGMMMALGLSKSRLFMLVILETIFLTLAGSPIGLLVSWIYTMYLNKYGIDWTAKGEDMMSSFGFSNVIYPEFPAEKLIPVMVIVSGTALLSCLFPAARALRLKPTDALRK